jgi:hypothetical protein
MSNVFIIQGGIYGDENKYFFQNPLLCKNYQNYHLDYCKNKEIPQ